MILVKNRELLIPNDERYIGTTYDEVSENRVFEIPRFAQNGVDLGNMTFKLDLEYANGAKDTAFLDVTSIDGYEEEPVHEHLDDDKVHVIVFDHHHKPPRPRPPKKEEWKILLTWEITSSVLQVPGTVFINIRATDENGTVKWASFRGALYVEDTINTPGTYTGDLTELEQLEAKVSGVIDSEVRRAAAEEKRIENENARINAENARNAAYQAAEDERNASYEISESLRERVFNGKVSEFDTAKAELIGYARESKSWAVGGTGTREGEDSDNAMYYSNKAGNSEENAKHYMEIASTYAEYKLPYFTVNYNDGEIYYQDATTFEFSIDPITGNMNYVPKEDD